MEIVVLGSTGLLVSPLCLGSMHFGVKLTTEQCEHQMDRFMELGGCFIDTAHVYNDWIPGERSRSEKIIGAWMHKRNNRRKVIISTKGVHPVVEARTVSRVDPKNILLDLEESLRFLQTDYIDLYLLHRDNAASPVAELLDCLNEQIRKGKVKAIGCSNWTLPRIKEAVDYTKKNNLHSFTVNQLMWSLARINETGLPDKYSVMDTETYAYQNQLQLPAMCFSSQAKGYFSRRYAGEKFEKDMIDIYSSSMNDMIYEKLLEISSTTGLNMTDLSLQFFRRQSFTAIPIVSCDNMSQLECCVHAFNIPIQQLDCPVKF
jgi:aryl-alcohol dehydrogenase-like predicted oxidoreductase